ncbi:MAG: hypothetical protein AAGF92_20530 [Myxococcota bacterium]
MDLQAAEDRWNVWIVQARNFAKRENYADAVARMRVVCNAVRDAMAQTTDAGDRARLNAHLARAEELLHDVESRADAWRSAIAARRQETIDQAAEEMARPLPLAADER